MESFQHYYNDLKVISSWDIFVKNGLQVNQSVIVFVENTGKTKR